MDWIPGVVRIYRSDWPRILLALLLAVGVTAAGLLKPWPLAQLLDGWTRNLRTTGVTTDEAMGAARWVVLLFGAYALHAGLGAMLNLLLIDTGLRGLRRVRQAMFDWLLGLSMRRLLGSKAGDLIYRATWDTFAFQTLFQQGVFTVLTATGSLVAMSVVMWQLNRPLTLVALATIPPLLGVMRTFGRGIGGRAEAAQQADSRLASRFQQTVAHLALVQAFNAEPHESTRFEAEAMDSFTARRRQHRFELGYLAGVGVVFAAGMAGIVWFGSRELAAGRLSLGTFLVFLAYLAQFYDPLQQISNVGTTVSNAGAGARRVLELLAQEPEPRPALHPIDLPPAAIRGRRLEFRSVSFAYQPGQPVLEGLNLVIEPGETVALVGPSGAGKSTLLQLVPRFIDPDSGAVLIDGMDLRNLRLTDLRNSIAWMPQEPFLLPGTIAENLAYGKPGVPRAEIEAAADAAQAHDFIRRLPAGYETQVGDGAIHMSVGEKQRLSLARAFLRNSPILLLDEPTSSLDAASEALVLDALARLRKGRTTLMVAHRLNTLAIVDRTISLRHHLAPDRLQTS